MHNFAVKLFFHIFAFQVYKVLMCLVFQADR